MRQYHLRPIMALIARRSPCRTGSECRSERIGRALEVCGSSSGSPPSDERPDTALTRFSVRFLRDAQPGSREPGPDRHAQPTARIATCSGERLIVKNS